jgi:phage shock protein C
MNQRFSPGPRLYRDIDRRWFAGVLAGAAGHFGWNLTALRIITIVACMTPIVPVVFVGYVLAAMFLPPRATLPPPPPQASAGSEWQSAPPPGVTASELRYRLREMEDRLRAMEAYVTSAQYEIDRQLKRSPD